MNRYITSADALKTLKQLLYETALNQFDFDTTEVYEDIAKNRLETWVDLIPTADVVEKERYDILLEHANILAEELRKYQNADVPERNVGKWIPVTERLPEKDGMYLVSISPSSRLEKRVDTDFYSHFGVWQIFGKFVTAWRELPEPYRKDGEQDEQS